jgi:hypothetical protein
VDCSGTFIDGLRTAAQLVVLGSATAGGATGYAWGMSALVGVPDSLVLEDATTVLTDESSTAVTITTEGQVAVWQDNGQVPLITATTDRFGYSEDIVWLYDAATVLTGSAAPIAITVTTPLAADSVVATPTPNSSSDTTYRTVCGLDFQGRGASFTISPTTAAEQWSMQRVAVVGIPSPAMADDQ